MTTDKRHMSDIESELNENRERMEHTLDMLQRRLSTESIVEQGQDYLRATGGDEFVYNLGRSVRRNPVPLTLLGVGIGWLMLASSERAEHTIDRNTPDLNDSPGAHASDAAASAGQRTKSAAQNLYQHAEQATSSGQAHLGQASDRVQRGASQIGQATRRGGTRLASGADYMYREQPLVTTALGLAFGAVIAASLPRSRSEDRAMGAARDEFVASAQQTGQEKAGQAQSVAESAAHGARQAAQSEAERQGMRDHEHENEQRSTTETAKN